MNRSAAVPVTTTSSIGHTNDVSLSTTAKTTEIVSATGQMTNISMQYNSVNSILFLYDLQVVALGPEAVRDNLVSNVVTITSSLYRNNFSIF